MLYRKHFGVTPVAVEAAAPLDVAAAWTADRKALTVGIVNPTMRVLDVPLQIAGAKFKGSGRRWQIAGDDPMADNAPGEDPPVKIEESPVEGVPGRVRVAPCSITLLSLDVP